MPTWLSDATANKHIKTYVKDFLDVSGNLTVRNDEDYKWNAYGQVLSGNYESDDVYFGLSVGMDVSGLTIVVGANRQDGANTANTNDGAVTVYRYDTTAEMWYQLGNTITGETNNDEFGYNVDINDAGTRIMATDADANFVNVYDYNSINNIWDKQVNITTSDGIVNVDRYAGRISGDGNTIVFCAYTDNSNTGKQYVYREISGTWTKIGEFTGSHTNTYAGIGPSISYDGNRIVFPEKDYNYDVDGNYSDNNGRVGIYDYSGSPLSWNQVGNYIYGEASGDKMSNSSDFSKDGSIVAIGTGEAATYVKVFQYNATDSDWNLLGSKILGPTTTQFGFCVRLSDDGTVLIVSDKSDDTAGTNNGALYIYKYINGDWVQQGSTLYSQYWGAELGFAYGSGIAMSGDGTKIVAGGLYANVNNSSVDTGYVQAWQWSKKAPYTNPILDVSGGVLTISNGEENNSRGYIITQVGSTLSGNTNSSFGEDVKLNANGSVVVIGASGENGMYVYKYRNDIWSQIGSKIAHSSYSGQGERVVINDDGTIVSTGTNSNAMNVWEFTNGDWSLKGTTITNGSGTIYFGNRGNAMNGAGNRVAGKSNSFIAAYEYDTSTSDWVQMGSNIIDSDSYGSGYTNELAMNKAGDILAIGMPAYDLPTNSDTGRVAIYKFTGDISDGSWNRMGNYITPPFSGVSVDAIGISVSLSDDGYTVAFSAPFFGANDDLGRGYVYKYSEIGNRWDPYGPEIKQADVFRETSFTTTRFASGINISGDGKTLAISDHNGSPTSSSTNVVGFLHVMKYIDGRWTWIGRLDGTDHGDYWATMCSISRDGTHFAGSATLFNFSYVGEVKVGKITNPPPIKIDKDGVSLDNLFTGNNVTLQCPTLKGVLPGTADYETFWGRNPGVGNWRTSFGSRNSSYLYIDNAYTSNFDLLLTGSFSGGGGVYQWGKELASRSGGALCFQTYISQGATNNDFSLGINVTPSIYRLYVYGAAWSNGSYYSSDDRIKHNETPLTNALETIRKLHPRHYIKTLKMYEADHQLDLDASGNPLDASGNPMPVSEYIREDGFIAQEVNEIPELKYTFNESLDENVPHGLDYTSIFTTAVKALKELDALDSQRQTKLSSLQARIDALENK